MHGLGRIDNIPFQIDLTCFFIMIEFSIMIPLVFTKGIFLLMIGIPSCFCQHYCKGVSLAFNNLTTPNQIEKDGKGESLPASF